MRWLREDMTPADVITAEDLRRADRRKVDVALEMVEVALNEAGMGYREAMAKPAVVMLVRMFMSGACDRETFVASIRLVLPYLP